MLYIEFTPDTILAVIMVKSILEEIKCCVHEKKWDIELNASTKLKN